MRALIACLVLTASPAAAQDLNGVTALQIDDLRMQQQLAQQRVVSQQNEITALETQLRADQAVLTQQQARAPVRLPTLPYPQAAPPASLDAAKLPAIPNAALAASNARVRAAAGDRR